MRHKKAVWILDDVGDEEYYHFCLDKAFKNYEIRAFDSSMAFEQALEKQAHTPQIYIIDCYLNEGNRGFLAAEHLLESFPHPEYVAFQSANSNYVISSKSSLRNGHPFLLKRF